MEPKNDVFQSRNLLFQGTIFRFHVKLLDGIYIYTYNYICIKCINVIYAYIYIYLHKLQFLLDQWTCVAAICEKLLRSGQRGSI